MSLPKMHATTKNWKKLPLWGLFLHLLEDHSYSHVLKLTGISKSALIRKRREVAEMDRNSESYLGDGHILC